MTERTPINDFIALDSLNPDEILEGYQDGRANDTEPGDNRSLSYWHGWRNGMLDGGRSKGDASQANLAKAFLEMERIKRRDAP